MPRRAFYSLIAVTIIGFVSLVGIEAWWSERWATLPSIETPLIDGFVSRQRAADVETKLRKAGIAIDVIEPGDKALATSRALPIRVVMAGGFQYLDSSGELRLQFVDDELASTWFYPDDAARFEKIIANKEPAVARGQRSRLHPATELFSSIDYRGKTYWAWEDVNLQSKVRIWIKNNT